MSTAHPHWLETGNLSETEDVVIVARKDGTLIALSPAAQSLLQISNEAVGTHVAELLRRSHGKVDGSSGMSSEPAVREGGDSGSTGGASDANGGHGNNGNIQNGQKNLLSITRMSGSTLARTTAVPTRKAPVEELTRAQRYEIEFEEIALIGYGGFGSVHKCRNRLDDQLYAVKKVFLLGNPDEKVSPKRPNCSRDVGATYTAQQLQEVKLLASFTDHPNIVRYFCSWVEYTPRQHVMELCGICGHQIPLNQMPEHLVHCEVLKEEENKLKIEKKLARKKEQQETTKRKKKTVRSTKRRKAKRREMLSMIEEESVVKKVTIQDFEILKRISAGAFGRVFLVKEKVTGSIYALKVIRKKDAIEKNNLGKVILERDILVKADNPYVVTLYYSFQSDENLYFVMEYLPGGDLGALLEHVGYLDEDCARFYVAQIVLALEHLHSKGIVHRDIKPDNILIDKNGYLKLTDFGLSYEGMQKRTEHPLYESNLLSTSRSGIRTQASMRFSLVGTPDYLAPEIILQTGHSFPSDWWALGVCLYEFLTGVPPFNAETPNQIFSKVVVRNLNWPSEECPISPEAKDLIERLLEPDPAKRLGSQGVDEVKKHEFFENIDWAGLKNTPPPFVPSLTDSHDTSYFTDRIRGSFDFTERELTPIPENEEEERRGSRAESPRSPFPPGSPMADNQPAEVFPTPSSPRVLNFSMINVTALKQNRRNTSPLAKLSRKKKGKKERKEKKEKEKEKERERASRKAKRRSAGEAEVKVSTLEEEREEKPSSRKRKDKEREKDKEKDKKEKESPILRKTDENLNIIQEEAEEPTVVPQPKEVKEATEPGSTKEREQPIEEGTAEEDKDEKSTDTSESREDKKEKKEKKLKKERKEKKTKKEAGGEKDDKEEAKEAKKEKKRKQQEEKQEDKQEEKQEDKQEDKQKVETEPDAKEETTEQGAVEERKEEGQTNETEDDNEQPFEEQERDEETLDGSCEAMGIVLEEEGGKEEEAEVKAEEEEAEERKEEGEVVVEDTQEPTAAAVEDEEKEPKEEQETRVEKAEESEEHQQLEEKPEEQAPLEEKEEKEERKEKVFQEREEEEQVEEERVKTPRQRKAKERHEDERARVPDEILRIKSAPQLRNGSGFAYDGDVEEEEEEEEEERTKRKRREKKKERKEKRSSKEEKQKKKEEKKQKETTTTTTGGTGGGDDWLFKYFDEAEREEEQERRELLASPRAFQKRAKQARDISYDISYEEEENSVDLLLSGKVTPKKSWTEEDKKALLGELLAGLPCTDEDCTITLYIQMELYESATLSDWLSMKDRFVDTKSNLIIFTQIVEGLAHIHSHGIIHRDLKPSNIFITDNDIVKIGDFGLATPKLPEEDDELADHPDLKTSQRRTDVGVGTMLYAAPEQLKPGIGYDEKADIFALGIIMAEMYCHPFATPIERIVCLSKLREPNPALPCNISEKFPDEAALIKSMLSLDPAKRPSTMEILETKLINEKVIEPRKKGTTQELSSKRNSTGPRGCINCTRKSALIAQLAAQVKEKEESIKDLLSSVQDLEATIRRYKRKEKKRKKKKEKKIPKEI